MRGNQIGLMVGGVIMIATGGFMVWTAQSMTFGSGGLMFGGIAVIVGGVVMLGAARWVGGILGGGRLQKEGEPGTARILAVQDTGVTVGGLTAIFRIDAEVTSGLRGTYRASFKLPVGRAQLAMIQPGVVLPVRVDPKDPQKVVYDQNPPAQTQAAMMRTATMAPAAAAPVQTRSVSDIVARGERAEAVVVSAQNTGRTAGEMAPGAGLAADQADDLVAIVTLRVEAIGRAPFEAVSAMRVPDGKTGVLAPGRRVPVAFLPDDPASTTTIDWARA